LVAATTRTSIASSLHQGAIIDVELRVAPRAGGIGEPDLAVGRAADGHGAVRREPDDQRRGAIDDEQPRTIPGRVGEHAQGGCGFVDHARILLTAVQ
jgi:hypothetical protein